MGISQRIAACALALPLSTTAGLAPAVFAAASQAPHARAAGADAHEAPSVRRSGLNTDLVLEIVDGSRVLPPGGVATLKYVLYSTEGVSGRIRLQVSAPDGWRVLDAQHVERERLLEAWDIVTAELRVAIPAGANTGRHERIRLTAAMADVPGVAEALTHVQVLSGAGVRAGSAHLAGSTMLGVSRVGPSGVERGRVERTIDLSGRLGSQTHLSLTYHRGPQESLTNYRYHQDEEYVSGSLRHRRWSVQFGNRIASSGSALTGPSVSGEGMAARHPEGRVLAELVLVRPTTFSGNGAGRLWRGSVGIRTARATIGLSASDFARPDGGYSLLPPVPEPTLDPDSLEELERERVLSSGRASTRVQGLGLEGTLQITRTQRLTLRGGALRLDSARQSAATGPSLELQYSLSGRTATVNARVRQMPPSVQGVYLAGDERSADGTLRLTDELRLVARAYQYEQETAGQGYRAGTEGLSLGVRHTRGYWRLEATGNHRHAYSSMPASSVRRTARLSLGLPVGPLSLNMVSELGDEETVTGLHLFRSYRGDLRWSGDAGLFSLTVGSYATAGAAPRLRADLLTSLVYGGFELAGGAWATRGWRAGGAPGMWTSIGLPVSSGFTLFVGLEHAEDIFDPTGSPWRFSLRLRKKIVVPLPFLRSDDAGAGAPAGAAKR